MYRALIATEPPIATDPITQDVQDAGCKVVAHATHADDIAPAVMRSAPDLVIAATASPSASLFEAARMIGAMAPCPFILFTGDADIEKIDSATHSTIHAYVIDGYARHRLRSIIHVARARFHHQQLMKEDFAKLSKRFEERKLVDRAKGVLMRSRGIGEDESFELLRNLAMKVRTRVGVAARGVIELSRAGEAVNRSGQLRMLSQRVVKCYAQAALDLDAAAAVQCLDECKIRVERAVTLLRKGISTKGYGDLVDRVAASWQDVVARCSEPPTVESVRRLDERAEVMLREAETLTEYLEASGLIATLRVLNVSGRQRMLSQRIAKLCFFLALAPDESTLAKLRDLTTAFQAALDYLAAAPLTTPSIAADLVATQAQWLRLQSALVDLRHEMALVEIAQASEQLLDKTERLTEQYEHAMQTLIGDRLGSM
jgi:AmiR/NasT family two-component response regulator